MRAFIVSFIGLALSILSQATSYRPTTFDIKASAADSGYAYLTLHSKVDCSRTVLLSLPNYITAHVVKAPRDWIRTHLVDGARSQVLSLGKVTKGQELSLELRIAEWKYRLCALETIDWEFSVEKNALDEDFIDWEQVAKQWSPAIVVRNNNYNNMDTDVLLDLRHVIEEVGDKKVISYTAYYSDEDSKTSKKASNSQNGSWGRTLDVEKVLELIFDSEGNLLESKHQAELHFFRDSGIDGNEQPVLYNIANNNVFSSDPNSGSFFRVPYLGEFSAKLMGRQREAYYPRRIAYSPTSSPGPTYPGSRDRAIFENPKDLWMLKTSDNELMREGKLAQKATEMLYVFVRGKLEKGKLSLKARLAGGSDVFTSGGLEAQFNRLGHHMWNRESLSAVVINEEISAGLASGGLELELEVLASKAESFELEAIQAFVVREDPQSGRYFGVDVTEALQLEI